MTFVPMETPSTSDTNRDAHLWQQAQKRVGFKQHLRSYLLVNGLVWLLYIVLVYVAGNHRVGLFPWPLFMTLGWGVGLLSHYLGVYANNSGADSVEREYQKLKAKGL
jgi:hypothetical protein